MDQASYGQKPTEGAPMNGRSPIAVKLDNLIRSKLRVSNPNDPAEIADGLKRFYKGAAERTRLEEAGLPFYQVPMLEPPRPETAGPGRYELDQAKSDVGKDLASLLQNQLLKDINPELRGWQSAIDNIIADGSEAAPLTLDPRMRDRGFQARRLLGDYARVARFVGALTPSLNDNFRALARSLDEVSSVLMVLMGDALANIGFSGGRFLLQATASDLQDRRDAALVALRNLLSSTQVSLDQDTWPRGLQAYQQFIRKLDGTGNSDLRALFQEANLAKLMDDLIARVNVMSADGLRALGSTAVLQVQPLRRLIQLGRRLGDPQSPPLAAFLLALELFTEAFQNSSSGSRLISIARPAILSYGLYGLGGPDKATARLNKLVVARGNLAVQVDCFMPCSCTQDYVRCQIILDKLLYDIDRAIDALTLGTNSEGDGEAETRAFAYGLIIETFLLTTGNINLALDDAIDVTAKKAGFQTGRPEFIFFDNLLTDLTDLRKRFNDPKKASFFNFNQCVGLANTPGDAIKQALTDAWQALLLPGITTTIPPTTPTLVGSLFPPTNTENTILQELCMQEDAESQWDNLLQTMAPSCFPEAGFIDATKMLVQLTRGIRELPPCGPVDITIPPDVATSLAGFVFQRDSDGSG
jgi:hypothetical protein